jgi:hypothetical protein
MVLSHPIPDNNAIERRLNAHAGEKQHNPRHPKHGSGGDNNATRDQARTTRSVMLAYYPAQPDREQHAKHQEQRGSGTVSTTATVHARAVYLHCGLDDLLALAGPSLDTWMTAEGSTARTFNA